MTAPQNDRTDRLDDLDQLDRIRQRRAVHRAQVLAELLDRRPDLWGVHSPADVAAEFVLWSA
ncbi:hypothetical protein [Nocardioides pyridinolyticus]